MMIWGAIFALISNRPDAEGEFVCKILKILSIPIVLYLFKRVEGKGTIYFFLNLGISRTEYYAIPIVIEYIIFRILFYITGLLYPYIDALINGAG